MRGVAIAQTEDQVTVAGTAERDAAAVTEPQPVQRSRHRRLRSLESPRLPRRPLTQRVSCQSSAPFLVPCIDRKPSGGEEAEGDCFGEGAFLDVVEFDALVRAVGPARRICHSGEENGCLGVGL